MWAGPLSRRSWRLKHAAHLLFDFGACAASSAPDQMVVAVEDGNPSVWQVEQRFGGAALRGDFDHPNHVEAVAVL